MTQGYEDMCKRMHRSFVPSIVIGEDSVVGVEDGAAYRSVSAVTFAREFVGGSRPCILKNMMKDWRALRLWQDDEYLFPKSSTEKVSIALTPNGRADCVTEVTGAEARERVFMSACDIQGTMGEFKELLQDALLFHGPCTHPGVADALCVDLSKCSTTPPIPYIQLQNNSLPKEFAHLTDDVSNSLLTFGTNVFGGPPDATNLWVGSSLSVSSMHQDWYENLYGVVRGTKRFTLVAPWEGATKLPKPRSRAASYVFARADDRWICSPSICFAESLDDTHDDEGGDVPPPGCVDWIDVDLVDTPHEKWPACTKGVHRVSVEVHEGDVLYLPAMWYHRVAQLQRPDDWCVVAVNYWFDMNFDHPLFELQAMLRASAFHQPNL